MCDKETPKCECEPGSREAFAKAMAGRSAEQAYAESVQAVNIKISEQRMIIAVAQAEIAKIQYEFAKTCPARS